MNWREEPSRNPFELGARLWPHVRFYKEQRELIESVWDNDETVCVAGNQLGKDFTTAFIVVVFFLTRHPCRIVTTSVDGSQLEGVLWGEMRRFIQDSRYPLEAERGGPLLVQHLKIRKVYHGRVCGVSYIMGRVAARGEGLQGHHCNPSDLKLANDGVPRTLAVGDECSGLDDESFRMLATWSRRRLYIGNPWPCENYFKHAVKGRPNTKDIGGDLVRASGEGYRRKVIRIRAEDSPNVRLALAQQRAGKKPTGEVIVPGCKTWEEYQENRRLWDPVQQCVSLDAEFWEGADVLMFPPEWLNRAHEIHDALLLKKRKAKAVGIDTGQGSANTVLTAADEDGILEQMSLKTPDTSRIPDIVVEFGERHGVPAERWYFDSGGGGYEHACLLRRYGYNVRAIPFGGAVSLEPRRGVRPFEQRKEQTEERAVYFNKRAELYGEFRRRLQQGYGVPRGLTELRRQLAPIPLTYDDNGKLKMLPKRSDDPDKPSLEKLLGRSPDEADSAVLAHYGVFDSSKRKVAGAIA